MAPLSLLSNLNVRKCAPELVFPAKPTPFQILKLSDLDQEPSLQTLIPNLHFYNYNPSMENVDPVKVLKEAVSCMLVFYFPLAGRLKPSSEDERKMVVECSDKGATFVEADSDFTIKDLGNPIHPPFPYLDELVPQLPGSKYEPDIFSCSLLNVQVTRMKCGGFIVGTRISNNIVDGTGCIQVLKAISEIARGSIVPSIPPIWKRELILVRDPPKVTFLHHEFFDLSEPVTLPNMAYRMFYFTEKEISALRKLAPHHLQKTTSFELITTCIWRTRAVALKLSPEANVRLAFAVNARHKYNPPLPKGYYGNVVASVGLTSTARDLYEKPFGYALEKVVKAKYMVTDEYMRSFIDELVSRGYPSMNPEMPAFYITDLRRLGFHEIDFGWGEPLYGGPGYAWVEPYPHMDAAYIRCKNGEGEDVTLAAICLPTPNMEVFLEQMQKLIGTQGIDPFSNQIFN